LTSFTCLANLRCLKLRHQVFFTGNGLLVVSLMTSLTRLDLAHCCNVPHCNTGGLEAFRAVAALPKLQVLECTGCVVENEHVRHLSVMVSLTRLVVSGDKGNFTHLHTLLHIRSLHTLEVWHSKEARLPQGVQEAFDSQSRVALQNVLTCMR
jgi:hypothetical protein